MLRLRAPVHCLWVQETDKPLLNRSCKAHWQSYFAVEGPKAGNHGDLHELSAELALAHVPLTIQPHQETSAGEALRRSTKMSQRSDSIITLLLRIITSLLHRVLLLLIITYFNLPNLQMEGGQARAGG